ncbi:23S rRNA pseudouridine(2604) synthase RluF, partial [Salmonella enterica subsp. enterica serovar Indiana]|nr:23S rRNA pseudouridine(2604) synthase RluF [Salmonella enterica subsp. enterica serovar Indiana]
EAKPKAKAKPKTTGIKRPVVAIEKSNEKARPTSSGKRFTSPGRKKKGR